MELFGANHKPNNSVERVIYLLRFIYDIERNGCGEHRLLFVTYNFMGVPSNDHEHQQSLIINLLILWIWIKEVE